jgi:hypothetical protein
LFHRQQPGSVGFATQGFRLFFGVRQHKKAASETLQILPAVKSN